MLKTCGPCCRHYVGMFVFIAMFLFLACYLWQYALTAPELKNFHEMLLKTAILGYTGHNASSLFLGLLQSAVWGGVIGGIVSIFEQSRSCGECNINVLIEE